MYESGNMDRMKMENVRRPQEMYRRSHHAESPFENIHQETDNIPINKNKLSNLLGGLFHEGKADKDILLTAALMYLLYKEGADIRLILALAYILI